MNIDSNKVSQADLARTMNDSAFNAGKSVEFRLRIGSDPAPFLASLASLEQVAKISPEVCKLFLGGFDSIAELCRVDVDTCSAAGASDIRVIFQPSDRLRDFLAAVGAGNL